MHLQGIEEFKKKKKLEVFDSEVYLSVLDNAFAGLRRPKAATAIRLVVFIYRKAHPLSSAANFASPQKFVKNLSAAVKTL